MCPDAIDEGRDSQVSVLSIMTKLSTLLVLTALTTPDYSFIQSEADTILFSAYAVLRDSSYSGPIVADTDTYMAAAPISQKLPGLLCIKETILCRDLVPEEMADCNWMSCQLRVLRQG